MLTVDRRLPDSHGPADIGITARLNVVIRHTGPGLALLDVHKVVDGGVGVTLPAAAAFKADVDEVTRQGAAIVTSRGKKKSKQKTSYEEKQDLESFRIILFISSEELALIFIIIITLNLVLFSQTSGTATRYTKAQPATGALIICRIPRY